MVIYVDDGSMTVCCDNYLAVQGQSEQKKIVCKPIGYLLSHLFEPPSPPISKALSKY
jgi:hypothetical protein